MRRGLSLRFPFFYDWLLNLFRKQVVRRVGKLRKRPSAPGCVLRPLSLYADMPEKGNTPVCLFGIHWFAPSGAEYYALECARIARMAGFEIVWLVDLPADDGGWESKFMEVSPYTIPLWREKDPFSSIIEVLRNIGGKVKAIHIHHSHYAYDHLSTLRLLFSEARVIDSTHIIEISNGGFPQRSLDAGDKVDIRNPISKGLSDYFTNNGVDAASIFRTAITPSVCKFAREKAAVFSVGVIGRLSQQKRPYLIPGFLKLLDGLLDKEGFVGEVDFHIFGYGPYSELLKCVSGFKYINVNFEEHCYEKDKIYAGLSCVIQLSENEGVSIVSYESASYGIPFIATDVGQQAEMVHPDMLLPRNPKLAVEKSARIVCDMITEPGKYDYVVDWQTDRLSFLRNQYEYKSRVSQLYRRLLD